MDRVRKVIWTTPAADELDEVLAWIAQEDPFTADRLANRVLARIDQVARFPSSGRRLPELRRSLYREVIVPPCRIVYRPEAGAILIVHVFRAERRLRRRRLR